LLTDPVEEAVPLVLTVAQVSRLLQVGRNAAYALIASGAIRSVRVGATIRVPRASLLAFIAGERPAAEEVAR
jgi:excisionase family DNA binding protein